MHSLFLAATILTVAGTYAFPRTAFDELFHSRRAAGAGCGDNPSDMVMGCMQPLEYLAHPTTGLKLAMLNSSQAIEHVCEELHEAKQCVGDVHRRCGQEDLMTRFLYESMDGVVGHICSEDNREVIMSEGACWSNRRMESDMQSCYRGPRGNMCRMVNGMRNCLRNAVQRHCNDRATQFLDDLYYYALIPMARHFNCELEQRVSRSLMQMFPFKTQ